jgi:hypothetical protein
VTDLRIECNKCGTSILVHTPVWNRVRDLGLSYPCDTCMADLTKHGKIQKPKKSNVHKDSRAQEKRMAKREGGRVQPGSGNVPGYEGDVRLPGKQLRGECKFTKAASYTLKLEDLLKLEKQAIGDELPVFEVEFHRATQRQRYIILPGWVYDALMEESGRRSK